MCFKGQQQGCIILYHDYAAQAHYGHHHSSIKFHLSCPMSYDIPLLSACQLKSEICSASKCCSLEIFMMASWRNCQFSWSTISCSFWWVIKQLPRAITDIRAHNKRWKFMVVVVAWRHFLLPLCIHECHKFMVYFLEYGNKSLTLKYYS